MIALLTSIVTLISMWLLKRKDWRGWAVGLANQALWLVLIFQTKTWGLLLLTGSLIVIYTQALIAWRRDEAMPTEVVDNGCPGCGHDEHAGWCTVRIDQYEICNCLDDRVKK